MFGICVHSAGWFFPGRLGRKSYSTSIPHKGEWRGNHLPAPISSAFHYLRLLTRESAALHFCASSHHPPMAAYKTRSLWPDAQHFLRTQSGGMADREGFTGGCKGHAAQSLTWAPVSLGSARFACKGKTGEHGPGGRWHFQEGEGGDSLESVFHITGYK